LNEKRAACAAAVASETADAPRDLVLPVFSPPEEDEEEPLTMTPPDASEPLREEVEVEEPLREREDVLCLRDGDEPEPELSECDLINDGAKNPPLLLFATNL
jgi:hypothetical protein